MSTSWKVPSPHLLEALQLAQSFFNNTTHQFFIKARYLDMMTVSKLCKGKSLTKNRRLRKNQGERREVGNLRLLPRWVKDHARVGPRGITLHQNLKHNMSRRNYTSLFISIVGSQNRTQVISYSARHKAA